MKIIPATEELIRSFNVEIPRSARVIAVVDGDRVLGIAGIYPDVSRQVVFSTVSEELKRHPKVMIQAARIVMKWVREARLPTHALCDEEIEHAAEFLKHFGFRHIYKGVYSWQG